jgi:NADH-quinone oxidoreductase subunit N
LPVDLPLVNPTVDFHALAPEIILTGALVLMLVADLVVTGRNRAIVSTIGIVGVLAALVPVLTLAADGADRSMFNGAYVVDNYALVFKAFFLVVAYVTILLSVDYIREGDYHEGEYYFLILTSVLGMLVMGSARDLLSIFVALETISIPTYMLAGWRKHDVRSNEAAVKYYIFGVLSSAVMLYGMSLVYGVTGSTLLREIAAEAGALGDAQPLFLVAIAFTLVGFAFKVSAVPFHFWAPDTYEGAPTPVAAFLSVASKAGGFVAIMSLVFVGFFGNAEVWQPVLWVFAALSMTVANVVALRQTNIVRMLAYSSVAQAGFMLVPLAVAAESASAATSAFEATIVYLLVYGAMNLGAFAVVIAVARRTRSGEISSYAGLFQYAPGLAVLMSMFLFSLAGIPPLGGWFAKLVMFRAVLDAGTTWAVVLGVVAAVNAVVAFFYYAGVARQMWFEPAVVEDRSPIRVPPALGLGIALSAVAVLVIGVYPQAVARLGELAPFVVGAP